MSRKLQKQLTKEKIIQTGIQLMSEHGIMATKTLDIAKAAGLSHGSIFVHFPTKNDLITAIIDEVGRCMSEAFQKTHVENQTLRNVLESHLKVIKDFEAIFAQLLIEGPLLPPAVKGTLFMLHSGVSYTITKTAKKEMHDGVLHTLDPHRLFNLWNSLLYYHLAYKDVFAKGQSLIQTKGPELIDTFMTLISTQKENEHDE